MNVVLDADEQPLEAAYSQHSSGRRLAWAAVGKRAGHAPRRLVALGSHANFAPEPTAARSGADRPGGSIPPPVRPILPMLPVLQVVDRVIEAGERPTPAAASTPSRSTSVKAPHGRRWWPLGRVGAFFTPIPLGPIPASAAAIQARRR